MRPPTGRMPSAAGIARSSTESSRLTSMRSAWKTRLAGWPARWAAYGVAAIRISTRRPGPVDRRLGAGGDDGPRVAARQLLLAVALEDPPQVALAVGREDVGGGRAGRLVHPHVERGVLRVREAAVGDVELQGRDAQVEEDAVCRGEAGRGDGIRDAVVHRVHEGHPVAERREPLAGDAQGVLVAVESDEVDAGEALAGTPRSGRPCRASRRRRRRRHARGRVRAARCSARAGLGCGCRAGSWSIGALIPGPDPHPL